LGGNAIAECQVFGRRAAQSAATFAQQSSFMPGPAMREMKAELERIERYLSEERNPISAIEFRDSLQNTMSARVGIKRKADSLQLAQSELLQLEQDIGRMHPRTRSLGYNSDLVECLENENMVTTARAIVEAALSRLESRGAHYRTDYPERDRVWGEQNTCVARKGEAIICSPLPVVRI
jgi:fumarate reductase (CoM/CoB) subunit A